ncbi:MAG TPA: MXAN_5808 family serine peptidase [Myxococcota bacterium]|nr:MXAN_5808 family serine peptidase [Myxococcota bacterium]HRY94992.1 MXAN_5808 family serine peptidase [Myxococcota bacterium]
MRRFSRLAWWLGGVLALGAGAAGAAEGKGAQPSYDLSRMEAFSWTILQLKQDYVDPTRVDPEKMLRRTLEAIERNVAEVEIRIEGGEAVVQVGPRKATFKVGQPTTVWELNYNLQPIFRFIAENLEPTTDAKDVEYTAINGLLTTLDPHSNLLPPELFREMQLKTTGEFGGLGIRISVRKGALTVISPLPDSPAARLGLKSGDQIVRIEDQSTVNMPLDEAVNLLRGPAGSPVTIWVKRQGWTEAHKYVINREVIRVRSIESRLLAGQVGYIQIVDFSRHTGGDFLRHLSDLKSEAKGLRGLIVDLRNNAGGLLKAAVQVADLLLDRGIIVATVAYGEDSTPEDRVQKSREEQRAKEGDSEVELPIVVLVNDGSASASEILAGALKNLDRAVLVGEQTFGKGTVQILNERVPPSIEGACLKLTVAEYLIPGDVSIQEVGVTPDVALVPTLLEEDGVRMHVKPVSFREENIPAHLKKQADKVALKPAFEIPFLDDPPPKLAPDEEPPLEEPGFKEDFTVRFAKELLLRVKSPRGSAMLDEAAAYLAEVSQAEQKKMVEALAKLKVDWSAGGGEGAAGSAGFKLGGEGVGGEGQALADKTVQMELSVRNTGSAPFYRLRAESRCENPLFDRREFLFGRLDPGQERTWKVPVKVPLGVSTRTDDLRFDFFAEGSPAPARMETLVRTQGVPKPSFGYTYAVREREGNGDGLLQAGEKAELGFTVTNLGEGLAKDARVMLRNESGKDLFLEAGSGRATFGELPPGESRSHAFSFHVPAEATSASLTVEVDMWDAVLGTNHVARLELPLLPPGLASSPEPGRVKAAADGVEVRATPDAQAPAVARLRKGAVLQADRRAGDWRRVQLPGKDAGSGWVRAAELAKAGAKARLAGPEGLRPFSQSTPPDIRLEALPAYLESGDRVVLRGVIVDEDHDLRDVAVWVGSKKVYLKPGSESRDPRRMTLEVPLTLEPGPNFVSVIAREGSRYSSQRTVVVTRPGGLDRPKSAEDEEDPSALME